MKKPKDACPKCNGKGQYIKGSRWDYHETFYCEYCGGTGKKTGKPKVKSFHDKFVELNGKRPSKFPLHKLITMLPYLLGGTYAKCVDYDMRYFCAYKMYRAMKDGEV